MMWWLDYGSVHTLYFCAAHNNFNACVWHIPGVRNNITGTLSCFQHHQFRRMIPHANPQLDISLHGLSKPISLPPAVYVLWCCPSTRHMYQSGIDTYLLFYSCFNITPTLTSSVILQYFWMNKSQSVIYKTLKVYLSVICLMYIENGLPDPTTDESLHLVCKDVYPLHSNSESTRLLIRINLLRTLKIQSRSSQMSLLEQHLL